MFRHCAILFTLAMALAAQSRPVSGIVVAGNGLPIAGATVIAGATSVVSGADGRFTLSASAADLTITAPGYTSRTIAAPGTAPVSPLRIVLEPAPLAEAVTVTATARNQTTAAVPLATAVMGKARLQAAAPVNADSILRQFSNLSTYRVNSSLTANPTTQGVALLGTGSSGASRALVLLDGLPLNDIYGGWVDWLRVPDEALESVSVVSGGASPLYGNDALSGVIGLETEAPVSTHLDLRAGGGSLGSGLADGAGVIAGKTLALAVNARDVHESGYVPESPSGTVDDDAGVSAQDWAPTLRWLRSPTEMFSVASEYFAEQRTNGTELTVNGTRLRQVALRGIVQNHGVWSGSVFDQSEDYDQTFSSVAANQNSETLSLEQQVPSQAFGTGLDWTLAQPRWSVMAGASYLHVVAVDNETTPANLQSPAREENGRQRLAGGFLEGMWTPLQHWSWTATLRQDHWSNFDAFQYTPSATTVYGNRVQSAWSPSLGTSWQARSWLAFHLSGYQSFRAPTLNELYRPFRVGNVETLANADLAAERYRGAQAGAEIHPTARLKLDATYFDGYVANQITSVTLSTTPSLITQQRENLGRVRPRGITLDGEWQLHPGVTLWSSYTHLSATVLSAATPGLVGLALQQVPRDNFSSELRTAARGWTLSAVERFGGANFDNAQNTVALPSFWNTDLKAQYQLRPQLVPYVAVENLWDRRYAIELTPNAQLDSPRAVTAGVEVHLGSR